MGFAASRLHATEVTARLAMQGADAGRHRKAPPAVIWLQPATAGATHPEAPGKFTLLQKNKMFTPHLLVVPVGSSVEFPNADPFFHNVFSLFDGRRFDLGLYEAGSTRSVMFSREGVSYIFCNIHPEMSAVVIALSTPFYSVADAGGAFRLGNVPEGDYELRVWVEGQRRGTLEEASGRVHVAGARMSLGEIRIAGSSAAGHLNKFGRPYEPDARPVY
jgi:plastocyanin